MKRQTKIEQPYNETEINLSQDELKRRHAARRKEFRKSNCPNCKHRKHTGHPCYAVGALGVSGIVCGCQAQ